MKFLVAFLGVAVILEPTLAEIEAIDPLECTPQEYDEALRVVPRAMGIFYKPLLTKNFNELRNTLANENTVRWHVDCILYDKACTSLGKAMQCEYRPARHTGYVGALFYTFTLSFSFLLHLCPLFLRG